MHTSYFFNSKLTRNHNLVSVAYKFPEGLFISSKIKKYVPLCPKWKLVSDYKSKIITAEQYTEIYYRDVLNKLNPKQVLSDLGTDAIILCWETPELFCHRYLIADWLRASLGLTITEL